MRRARISRVAPAVLAGILVLGLFWLWPNGKAVEAAPPGTILKVFSVGGVLTSDGTLWQYRPDRGRWMTMDEAFADQGKTTHVLPLPVPAGEIREMVTWGFLLTESGQCWLYDIENDQWEKLSPPPSK